MTSSSRIRFEALGDTIITTDDGSLGIHGRVAAGLEELNLFDYDQIYLCGPEMMMWDIISRTREHAGKTQACINRYFKCAAGICGSCCLDPEGVRVCVEGPVIMADRLLESEFGRYRRGPTGGKGPLQRMKEGKRQMSEDGEMIVRFYEGWHSSRGIVQR